jgi:hypothetical protein
VIVGGEFFVFGAAGFVALRFDVIALRVGGVFAADVLLQVGVGGKSTAGAVGTLERSLGDVAHQVVGIVIDGVIGDGSGVVAMFPEQVTVAVRLRGEQKGTVAALEGLLSRVGQDVTAQRRAPGEFSAAEGTADSVGGHGVR